MARRLIVLVAVIGLVLALAATALGASVTVRVEGKTQSIFGSTPVKVDAPNALVALDVASTLGEFYCQVTQSSFGPYVSQIGRYPGAGSAGWVFKVNGVSPPVGADQVTLKDGDEVLWYYATFGDTGGPPTLSLKSAGGELLHGRRRSMTPASRRPRSGAQVHVDGRRVKAAANGRACVGKHVGTVSRVRRRRRAVERREVSLCARHRAPPRRACALAGCGGEGPTASDGTARLWVTRDRGQRCARRRDGAGRADAAAGAAVEGGGDDALRRWLRPVDRRRRGQRSRRHQDWFWFVNGLAGDRSAASYRLRDGDVAWWDYRDWSGDAETLEVVAGAFPEPFLHGYDGKVTADGGAVRAGPARRRRPRRAAPRRRRRRSGRRARSPRDANLFELATRSAGT